MATAESTDTLTIPVADKDCDGLPRCQCGRVIRFAGCGRCEDCFAADSEQYHGNDQLAKTF